MSAELVPRPIPDEVREKYRALFVRFSSNTGTLYDGRDPDTGRSVVIKAVTASAFASATDRQRARKELQKLKTLRHPHLANVVDFGESNDITWIVREFVYGETLNERLASRGRLSAAEIAALGVQLAAALGELHRAGMMHRDLRPGHVIIGLDGQSALIDAALTRHFTAPDGRVLSGSPGYISPEALLGRQVSFRSDLYALGAVLYEALAGVPPFLGIDPSRVVHLQLEADPEPLDGAVPSGLSRLIGTLLARDPRDRPFAASMIERQLTPFLGSEPAPPSDATSTLAQDNPEEFSQARSPGSDERTMITNPWSGSEGELRPAAPHAPSADPLSAPTPIIASREVTPPAPLQAHSVPINRPGPKATLLGLAPDPDDIAQWESSPRIRAVSGDVPVAPSYPGHSNPTFSAGSADSFAPLDYDDLSDTNQNEASRIFGVPDASADGSAVPPLPDELAQQVLSGQLLDKPSPLVQPWPAPPPGHPAPTTGNTPQPIFSPRQFPDHGSVQSQTPPTPPDYPAQAPFAPPPSQFPPSDDSQSVARTVAFTPGENPSPQSPGFTPQPQTPWVQPQQYPPGAWGPAPGQIPYGAPPPSEGGPYPIGQQTIAPPAPTPARSSRGPWLIVLSVVVLIAGITGWFFARHHRARTPETPPLAVAPLPARGTTPTAPESAPPTVPNTALSTLSGSDTPDAGVPTVPDVTVTPDAGVTTAPEVTATPDAGVPTEPDVTVTPDSPSETTVSERPTPRPERPRPAPLDLAPIDAAMRARDWARAKTLLQEALRRHRNDPRLHALLGDANDRLGDQRAALTEYRTATRLARRNTNYLHRRADLELATGNRTAAIATLHEIQRIRPDDRAAAGRLHSLGQ